MLMAACRTRSDSSSLQEHLRSVGQLPPASSGPNAGPAPLGLNFDKYQSCGACVCVSRDK